MDQRDLVERAKRGDHDAFATLAGAAVARLDAAARLILRDPELARDAVQDAIHPRLADPAGASRSGPVRRLAAPARRPLLHRHARAVDGAGRSRSS